MFSLSKCPFSAGGKISDRRFFVGRTKELEWIISQIIIYEARTINVVGDYKMGKSSLLYHLSQIYEQCVPRLGKNTTNYLGIYLSLGSVRSQSDFYSSIAYQLLQRPSVQANQALTGILTNNQPDSLTFSDNVWKEQKVRLLFCLDDFENLFRYPREFNNSFYETVFWNFESVGLVVASYKPIKCSRIIQNFTSNFFSRSRTLLLSDLTEADARALVQLPPTISPTIASLSPEAEDQALQWGGLHPFVLQMVCYYLWQAQENNLPLNYLWTEYCCFAILRRLFGRYTSAGHAHRGVAAELFLED